MQTVQHALAAQDLHGLKKRRGNLATGDGHANRSEGHARLDIHTFNNQLTEGMLQSLGCEGAVVVLDVMDRRVQNLRRILLELRYGLFIQLKRIVFGEEEAQHSRSLAQQLDAGLDERRGMLHDLLFVSGQFLVGVS